MKRLIAGLLGLVLSLNPLLADDSYEMRLHRPVKVGDRFKLAAKVAVDMETSTILNADDIEEESVAAACRLQGELMVLSTTPKGLAKEVRLKLSEAQCMDKGEVAHFFKTGDTIYLRHDQPDTVVQINGSEPDATQSEIIDAFLYVQGDENATDDELLGITSKVKPGESWPVNKEALVKDWVREGFAGLKAEDLKGSTTFSEVTKLDGKPAARLRGEFKIENAGLQLPSLPEELRAKRFMLEINDETELPLDPAGTAAFSKSNMKLESESSGIIEQDGQAMKVRVKLRQRCAVEVAVTPIE